MFTFRRLTASVAGGVGALILAALPAAAVSYQHYSQSRPLQTKNAHGQGYGTWRVGNFSDGTQHHVAGVTRDRRAGGDSIYWQAEIQNTSGICLSSEYASCTQDFYGGGRVDGVRHNSGSWKTSNGYRAVSRTSKGTRANLRVCEDLRFRPDNCSGWSVSSKVHRLG